MPIVRRPSRWWKFCISENEKIKTFTEQCFYCLYNLRVLGLRIVQNFFLVGLFWPFVLKYIFENV